VPWDRWWRALVEAEEEGAGTGTACPELAEHEARRPVHGEVRMKTSTEKEKRRGNDQTVIDSTKQIYYGVENDDIYPCGGGG